MATPRQKGLLEHARKKLQVRAKIARIADQKKALNLKHKAAVEELRQLRTGR